MNRRSVQQSAIREYHQSIPLAGNFGGLKFWRIIKQSPKSALSITVMCEPGAGRQN